MEGLFRQIGIYSPTVSSTPRRTASRLLTIKKTKRSDSAGRDQRAGRRLFLAGAATSYSTNNLPMIPFYIYYSCSASSVLAICAGRLATSKRGLPDRRYFRSYHPERRRSAAEDGHSHIQSLTIPNCISYDPLTLTKLLSSCMTVWSVCTVKTRERLLLHHYAERKLPHAGMPEGAEEGIRKGIYKLETIEVAKVKFSCSAPVLSCVTSVSS